VVLTVREDFLRQAGQLAALKPVVDDPEARFAPPAMSARELRRVIEQPASMAGLKFDEGIVDDLVKEVAGEPTALPLLQFSLLRLWENKDRNRISWEAYRTAGSPREALKRTADATYKYLPQDLDQRVARLIFHELVQPAVGVEFVRRRVRRESLRRLAASATVDLVLARFTAAGLVRMVPGQDADDDRFEVAHEALIRNWPLLSERLETDRDRLQQRLRLRAAAELCRDNGWDPGGLLSGPLLEEAQRYPDLDATEQEFVRRSLEAVRRAELEKEEARQRELEQAHRAAAAERSRAEAQIREARIWRWAVGLLLVMLALTVGVGVYAYRVNDSALRIELKAAEDEAMAQARLNKVKIEAEESAATAKVLKKENESLTQTLVALRERPALLVCKDRIDDFVPDSWNERLRAKQEGIRTTLRSTGRIQVAGLPGIDYGGTGFVVGENVVLMPRFIAELFAESDRAGGWRFKTAGDKRRIAAAINFTGEKCGTPPASYDIVKILYLDEGEEPGVALLETKPLGTDRPPLPLAYTMPAPPEQMPGRLVYIVSYPALDDRLPPEVQDLILRGASGFKRLSPGKIIKTDDSLNKWLGNDCTTMGGSGGGPLVDLETEKVIGISYSGQLRLVKENKALPMWTISKNPRVRAILDAPR
jgi:hypothetical protein